MKRFVFRLEAHLNLCRQREEAERHRLAALNQEAERLRSTRALVVRSLEEHQDRLSGAAAMPAYEANWYVCHIQGLRNQIAQLDMRLAACRRETETQRAKLVEARRRLRPVEKLKERRREAYEAEAARLLQQEADDLHLQRLARLT